MPALYSNGSSGALFSGKGRPLNIGNKFKTLKKFYSKANKANIFFRKKNIDVSDALAADRKESLKKLEKSIKADKELAKIRRLEKEIKLRQKIPFAP